MVDSPVNTKGTTDGRGHDYFLKGFEGSLLRQKKIYRAAASVHKYAKGSSF